MEKETPQTVKNLNVRLSRLEGQRNDIFEELKTQESVAQSHRDTLKVLDKNISRYRNRVNNFRSDPVVTEHAQLRYIERIMGIDLQKVIDTILDIKTKQMVKTIGSGNIVRDEGYIIVAKNYAIVTIKPRKENKQTKKK